jgi:hypothetical protein
MAGRAGVGLYLTIGDIRGEIGFAFQQDESQSLNSDRKASSSTWLLGASQ